MRPISGHCLPAMITFAGGLALGGGGGAEIAVAIADCDDRQPGRARRGPARAISHGVAFLDLAHLRDPALEIDHRAHGIFLAGNRISAEQRDAGPHQIAMRGAAEEYPGRIDQRGRHAAKQDPDLAKQPDLPVVHRVIERFGAGEMAHQELEAVPFRLDARRDGDRLLRRQAEPVHAGVDVQGGATAPIVRCDEGVPLGKLGRAVDHRPQIGLGDGRRRARHQAVEDVDDGVRRGRAHAAPFRDIGHEEGPAADLLECRHDPLDAAAIGVGLDHRGTFDRQGHAVEPLPVGGDGGQIDGEHAAGLRLAGGDHGGLQRGLLQGHGGLRSLLARVMGGIVPTAHVGCPLTALV